MPEENVLPIIKCFRNGELVFLVSTSEERKYIVEDKEFPKVAFEDFDWLELIEPTLDSSTKKRVVISCTPNAKTNKVVINKSISGHFELEIDCKIRNLAFSNNDDQSGFRLKVKGGEAQSNGVFHSFYVKHMEIDGDRFSNDGDDNPAIFNLKGMNASKPDNFFVDFLLQIGLGHLLKIGGSQNFYFIEMGVPNTYALQCEAISKEIKSEITIGSGVKIEINSKEMKFGQKTRLIQTNSLDENVPFAEPGHWTLWSLGYDTPGILKSWNTFIVEKYSHYVFEKTSLVPQLYATKDIEGWWALPSQVRDLAPNKKLDKTTTVHTSKDPKYFCPNKKIAFRFGPFQPVKPSTVKILFANLMDQERKRVELSGELRYLNSYGGASDKIASMNLAELKALQVEKAPLNPENLNFDDDTFASFLWIDPSDTSKPDNSKNTCRLGAFELQIPNQIRKSFEHSTDIPYELTKFSGKVDSQVKVSFDANIPLASVNLAGQDSDYREALDASASGRASEGLKEQNFYNSPPIVIPLNSKNASIKNIFASISENNYLLQDPRLSIRIKKNNNVSDTEPRDLSAVVLDNSPFSVVKIDAKNLFASLQSERNNSEIAIWTNWDPDGTGWKLLSRDHIFDIILPPQSLGEEFIKTQKDPTEKYNALEYKYSPTARLTVQTDDESRRFGPSPWNIRRILGFPSDRQPGCKLRSLQFELLYGLNCNIKSQSLNLTELFSRLGWTPDYSSKVGKFKYINSEQEAAYERKVDEWNCIKESMQSRLCVYMPALQDKLELALTDGVEYQIRSDAHLRYPIAESRVPLDDVRRITPPFRLDGLEGGVTWGFESANILDSIMLAPNSTDGKLVEPHFSALGGWGYQKAVFQNGLTKIYSNTAMGRTFFYSIERLGRIAIFGNLAKHVIIYERSVSPSKQFYSKQDPHLGRPIVRKVKEFIEILEPLRSYPDSRHLEIHRGFTKAVEFNTRIILVDSDWGNDVGNYGWEIPLWNTFSAEFQPQVYPKPLVALHCLIPNTSQTEVEHAEPILIENPQQLFFYTATSPGVSANPHEWEIVPSVDFPMFAMPENDETLPDQDEQFPDGQLPSPVSVAPGMQRFTFELVNTVTEANICAGRTQKGVATQIKNVTVCRAAKGFSPTDQLTKIAPVRDRINQLNALLDVIPDGIEPKKRLENLRKQYKGEIIAFIDKWPTVSDLKNKLKEEVPKRLQKEIEPTYDRIIEYLDSKTNYPFDQLKKHLRHLGIEVLKNKAELEKVLDENLLVLNSLIRPRKRLLPLVPSNLLVEIETQLDSLISKVKICLSDVKAKINQVSKTLDEIKADIKNAFERIKEWLNFLIKSIDRFPFPFLSKEQNLISNELKDLVKTIDQLISKIDSFTDIDALIQWYDEKEKEILDSLNKAKNDFIVEIEKLTDTFSPYDTLVKYLESPSKYLRLRLHSLIDETFQSVEELIVKLDLELSKLKEDLKKEKKKFVDEINNFKSQDPFKRIIDESFKLEPEKVKALLKGHEEDIATFKKELKECFFDHIDSFEKDIVDSIKNELPPIGRKLESLDSAAYNLQSAVCKQLNNPPFKLNRDTFRAVLAKVDLTPEAEALITPCLGLIDRGKDELNDIKALGMRLSTKKLFDRVKPHFDFSKEFSDYATDWGGLKVIHEFFPNFKPDATWSERFEITKGIDKKTLKAWLRIAVRLPIERNVLFEKSPVKVTITSGELYAESFFSADSKGVLQRTTQAHILGNWIISVQDSEVLEFKETKLYNDAGGNLKFDVSPTNINLKGVLGSVSDLMSSIPGADSAFEIGKILQDLGKPISIDCDFDMNLPDISGGCFSIKGLKLNAGLGISIIPTDFESFALSTRLSLGRKEAPFVMTVYFLGGGGWFEFKSSYLPMKNRIATFLSIGVALGASFDIALGPIKGGVLMSIGIGCEFTNDGAGNSKFGIVVIFTLRGEVDLCGVVSAYISLSLSLTYERGGGTTSLIGRGHLEVEIEICWCFTLCVDYDAEYRFIGSKEKKHVSISSAAIESKIETHAQTYVDTLA